VHTPNPTIQADLDQLQTDLKKASTDAKAAHAKVLADSKALNDELDNLRASDSNLSNELAPLKQQIKDDTKAEREALKPDNKAIADLRESFSTTFRADRKELRDAKIAKDSAAAQTARDQLKTDGNDYSNQLHDLHAQLVADAAPFKDKIKADKQAVWDKMISLDPTLGPLVDQLHTDTTDTTTTLKADDALVKADLDKLQQDRQDASTTATA
jgi:chromosome segregation ATPase